MTQEKETYEGSSMDSHDIGTAKGEEAAASQGKEVGMEDTGTDDKGRPQGTRTARSATSVNPENQEKIDPEMPNMPPA